MLFFHSIIVDGNYIHLISDLLLQALIKIKQRQMSDHKNTHNKSGKTELSVSDWSTSQFELHNATLNQMQKETKTGLSPTKCKVLKAKDGRISYQQRKVAYGYQVVAYGKYGRARMQCIPASKRRNDLMISHLCGTRNCLISNHLHIEQKWINDERTHCHFCLKNIQKTTGKPVPNELRDQLCPHYPKCGDDDDSDDDVKESGNVVDKKVPQYTCKLQESLAKQHIPRSAKR